MKSGRNLSLSLVLLVGTGILSGCSEKADSAQSSEDPAFGSAKASAKPQIPLEDWGGMSSQPEITRPHTAGQVGGVPEIASGAVSGYTSSAPQTVPTIGMGYKQKPVIAQAVADELEGKMSPEDLSRTFEESAPKLNVCLKTDTSISVKLKILPSGRVAETSASKSNPNDVRMRDCLIAVVQRLTFPRLRGAEPATVNIELSLKKT